MAGGMGQALRNTVPRRRHDLCRVSLLMVFATDCCSLKHQRRIEFMNGRLTTIKLSGSVTKFSYKWGFEKFALADGRGRDIEGEL